MIVLDRMVRPLGGFGEALERLFGDLGFVSERFEKLLGGFVASRGYIGRFWEASQRIWGNFGEVSAWSAGRWRIGWFPGWSGWPLAGATAGWPLVPTAAEPVRESNAHKYHDNRNL